MANKKNKTKKSSGGGATSKETGGIGLLTTNSNQGSHNGGATTSRLNDEDEALRQSLIKAGKPGSSQMKTKHQRKSIRLNSGKGDVALRSSTQEDQDLLPSQSITNIMKA